MSTPRRPLPPLPQHVLVPDGGAEPEGSPFLTLRREVFRLRFENGERSETFVYDTVHRTRLDAVVIAAHFRGPGGRRRCYLRSAFRPPVATRPLEARPFPERASLGGLWELPAGLVEEDERTPEGVRACAARELHEELGFQVDPAALAALGPSSFPAPGMIGERHFYFHVEVDPASRVAPPEDGSPLERHAAIFDLPLDELLDLARAGELEDAKTELGLRRLAEMVP
jgi:ADP-ribose pyrophosphatase